MKFKPFTKTFDFTGDPLNENYPEYLHEPIAQWIYRLLKDNDLGYNEYTTLNSSITQVDRAFVDRLQTLFRMRLPGKISGFTGVILSSTDLTSNFLALMLQNYAKGADAARLETILADGGLAFAVEKTNKNASEYDTSVYDLVMRVPEVVKIQSSKALNNNELLQESWSYCYARNPDYEKVVSKCCDFLEGYLGRKYFPSDPKPQLKKFIHSFQEKPSTLNYKGSSIVRPKDSITNLLELATNIRGQHTQGKGRKPTKDEAEFVLHTTIYIWNLHEGIR